SFWVGRWWRLIMFTCSTITRLRAGTTNRTLPRLPFSLPAITSTVSFFRIDSPFTIGASEDLGSQRDDLQELALPQLPRHRSEDPRPDRVVLRVQEDGGIPVELDVGPVGSADLLGGPHDHRAGHLALLHRSLGRRLLHRHDDRVADGRVLLVGAAHHPDALDLLGSRVVGDVEHRPRLNHMALRRPAPGSR